MDKIKKRLIHIHSCRGIGWKTISKFWKFDSSLLSIFSLKEHEFSSLFQMTEKNRKLFYSDLHSQEIVQILEQYERDHISLITLLDPDYPAYLRQIYDPPWVLYFKGKKTLLESNCLSVVGTRNLSQYGYNVMETILPGLIQKGWTIVSGLAIGVDSAAHHITIKEKGNTIAVLGSGINQIYPFQNKNLANHISTYHLLLSEFPPNSKPEKWHFPFRNRIISGLSKGTIIIEARERSGSLITAEQALDQGRDVFAVPGSIFESRSQGTNRLIQQGAKLVVSAKDIIEEF